MSIIASILLAATVAWESSHTNGVFNYDPPTQTLEFKPIICTPVDDCYVRLTVTEYTNLMHQVDVLWTAHTNHLANIERHRKAMEERKSALDKVKDNLNNRKRKSKMGRSAGGVK